MILNHSKKGFGKYDESKVRKVTGRGEGGIKFYYSEIIFVKFIVISFIQNKNDIKLLSINDKNKVLLEIIVFRGLIL
jgi:hypothetical protein